MRCCPLEAGQWFLQARVTRWQNGSEGAVTRSAPQSLPPPQRRVWDTPRGRGREEEAGVRLAQAPRDVRGRGTLWSRLLGSSRCRGRSPHAQAPWTRAGERLSLQRNT